MAYSFDLYKDKAGEYRVRFKWNSQVLFSMEGCDSEEAALTAVAQFRKNVASAPVRVRTGPHGLPDAAVVDADMVLMPSELTPAMEECWRGTFMTHARRRRNAGPRNIAKLNAQGSAEQTAYRALVALVRKHGGFPP